MAKSTSTRPRRSTPTQAEPDVQEQPQQPDAATALLRFLSSPDAAAVITKAGLKPLSER